MPDVYSARPVLVRQLRVPFQITASSTLAYSFPSLTLLGHLMNMSVILAFPDLYSPRCSPFSYSGGFAPTSIVYFFFTPQGFVNVVPVMQIPITPGHVFDPSPSQYRIPLPFVLLSGPGLASGYEERLLGIGERDILPPFRHRECKER
ncbi:uncharacterized protein EV420DRAFT_1485193 [Desarmillaria tabescens]|uniref:Uncharacterized protein n=1 Tax=Armillaria tabescens TaxID=1929756 RepID=A0AA39MQQ9_ARMTA|nr:uncharacterized protein EV420DRAFT_1485193 [Desarmillaria tabescens]KAK0442773.1 hypothetical protein EV420DRAFT_1485193 [Desarmillaria tabescens]